jgi:hypothetical protein
LVIESLGKHVVYFERMKGVRKMRKLTILIMVLGLLICTGITAQAAESGAVAVTSTIVQGLDMSVNPTTWAAGSVTAGSTSTTFDSGAQGYFTVTNSANGTSKMDIKAAITGGCSLGTTAGANIYRIGYGQATGSGTYTEAATYAEITVSDADLATIASGNTYKFDLQLKAPTSTTYGGVQQTITVTITAKTS